VERVSPVRCSRRCGPIATQAADVAGSGCSILRFYLRMRSPTSCCERPNNVTAQSHATSPPASVCRFAGSAFGQPTGIREYAVHGTSTRWYVLTFGYDTSLTRDREMGQQVTGLGTPNARTFVTAWLGRQSRERQTANRTQRPGDFLRPVLVARIPKRPP